MVPTTYCNRGYVSKLYGSEVFRESFCAGRRVAERKSLTHHDHAEKDHLDTAESVGELGVGWVARRGDDAANVPPVRSSSTVTAQPYDEPACVGKRSAHLLSTLTVDKSECCSNDAVAYVWSVPRTVASSE